MRKKKIIVVGYLPPPYGGLEAITRLILSSNNLKKNFDLSFFKIKTRKETGLRGKVCFLNIIYNVQNLFNYFIKILLFGPEIIYSPLAQNRVGFLRDSFFILFGKAFRCRVIVHFHGGNFDLFYKNQPNILKTYIKFILKSIDRLIVLSRAMREQFTVFLEKERINVIYNCIESDIFFSKDKISLTNKNPYLTVLFVGYISKAKGAVDLVKAASLILNEKKNFKVKFSLIGSVVDKERNITFLGEADNAYKSIKEFILNQNLSEFIKLYPKATQEFKIRSFVNADIFVFPSYSEGFGLVVLEAMAAGLPVIMSKVGGLSEILEERKNCFFITAGDYKDLANKIVILLEDYDLRKQMCENNRLLVKERFYPQRFINELIELCSIS